MQYSSYTIDQLVRVAVFGSALQQQMARFAIWQRAQNQGAYCASIHELYIARATGKLEQKFTVPAVNVRGMTYDVARGLFAAARAASVGAFIFEIARSEMTYTNQVPLEYSSVILAAAVAEGYVGPIFIQGDHFQAKAKSAGVPQEGELEAIKELTLQALQAGFYNIDIDMSTLVDLDAGTVALEQVPNSTHSFELLSFIRKHEPSEVITSVGVEIGHIGGKNSTVADFEAFMHGLESVKQASGEKLVGPSKISVATGTSHGGVVQADGSLADVALDFSILRDVSLVAREKYGIGGSVQHGASTLPDSEFSAFPEAEALEVHLATGIQNMIFDHPAFPKSLLQRMYSWIDETKASERKKDQTDEQFHYELRKKAWGQFKRECWELPEGTRLVLRQVVQNRFLFLFAQLGVENTHGVVLEHVTHAPIQRDIADFSLENHVELQHADVRGLSD